MAADALRQPHWPPAVGLRLTHQRELHSGLVAYPEPDLQWVSRLLLVGKREPYPDLAGFRNLC
jgi:hypothetical protein